MTEESVIERLKNKIRIEAERGNGRSVNSMNYLP